MPTKPPSPPPRRPSRRPCPRPEDAATRFDSIEADLGFTRPGEAPIARPSHRLRVLRPADLVVLDVLGYGLRIRDDGCGPTLEPDPAASRAWLEVRHGFQHLAEQAFYVVGTATPATTHEGPAPSPTEIPTMEPAGQDEPITGPPVLARAAYPSRVVFDVPDGERIPLSIEGVLAALSRLPLRVAPLATPRAPGRRPPIFGGAIALPGGLVLARTTAGLALLPAPRQDTPPAPASRAARLIAASQALRSARRLMSTEVTQDLRPAASRTPLPAGGIGDLLPLPGPVAPLPTQEPRAPRADETAIEAPYRLILSPSARGGFAHPIMPARAPSDPERVELWHSRLGVRRVRDDGAVWIDERDDPQRAVRAIWARDKEGPEPTEHANLPFRMSLDGLDRVMLVRQTADPRIAPPEPVDARRLYLSSLGAWLDLRGRWDINPYAGLPSILAWDHEAPMGRDQFVRVVYPGYLFPFGHRCALVKVTERKILDESVDPAPQARLYQRKFLVISEPRRSYDDRSMPFTQVALHPLTVPDLDDPQGAGAAGTIPGEFLFWPMVDGAKLRFRLDCLDHDGRRVVLRAPLLFVAAHLGATSGPNGNEKQLIIESYEADRDIPGDGQSVVMAPSAKPGDTAYESVTLRFTGEPGDPGALSSAPRLASADVVVPAMRHLAPDAPPVQVAYADPYLASGFAGANAGPQVFLALSQPASIAFTSTDRSGGFVRPDMPVRGLSRALGTVGDIASLVSPPSPDQAFDPAAFLAGAFPKLFGLFSLVDILEAAGLDAAPVFLTEQLDTIAAMLADLEALSAAVASGVARTAQDAVGAATDKLREQAEEARARLASVQTDLDAAVASLAAAIETLLALDEPSDLPTVTAAVSGVLDDLRALVDRVLSIVAELPLPPTVKAELERFGVATAPLVAAGRVVETIGAIASFVNGFDPGARTVRARFEWRPRLRNFPPGATTEDEALFFVDPHGLTLSVEVRASSTTGAAVDVLAELRDFGLNLFPRASLVKLRFDRLAFRAPSGRKPEVDVVFTGMEWLGVLGFIDTLRRLVPFDGFSDPPYVEVDTSGVVAGFDLALPQTAVGVFSLENVSLGADVRVPFLGDAVTVGFFFCTRERPFRLTVMMIGGGGFVGLRLSPKGLVLLEMALEAGASLSVNFGIASGMVSATIGMHLRLEGQAGSLTGYFRIRGEVDVLGLISAAITLELSLTYEFDTGKMVGRAALTIEVEVLFFSISVTIRCERRLAGSKGDPTFAQVLGIADDGTVPLPGAPDGGVPAWSQYCAAFAAA